MKINTKNNTTQLIIGDEVVIPSGGSYSWSFTSEIDGEWVAIAVGDNGSNITSIDEIEISTPGSCLARTYRPQYYTVPVANIGYKSILGLPERSSKGDEFRVRVWNNAAADAKYIVVVKITA